MFWKCISANCFSAVPIPIKKISQGIGGNSAVDYPIKVEVIINSLKQ